MLKGNMMKHGLDSAYWYMDTHFVDLLLDGVLLKCQAEVLIWVLRFCYLVFFSLIAKPNNWKRRWIHQAGLSPGQREEFGPSFKYDLAGYTVALQRIED